MPRNRISTTTAHEHDSPQRVHYLLASYECVTNLNPSGGSVRVDSFLVPLLPALRGTRASSYLHLPP